MRGTRFVCVGVVVMMVVLLVGAEATTHKKKSTPKVHRRLKEVTNDQRERGMTPLQAAESDDLQNMFTFLPIISRCKGECPMGITTCPDQARKCAICIELMRDFAANRERKCYKFEDQLDDEPDDTDARDSVQECDDIWTELTPHVYKVERHLEWCGVKEHQADPDCYLFNVCQQMTCCQFV